MYLSAMYDPKDIFLQGLEGTDQWTDILGWPASGVDFKWRLSENKTFGDRLTFTLQVGSPQLESLYNNKFEVIRYLETVSVHNLQTKENYIQRLGWDFEIHKTELSMESDAAKFPIVEIVMEGKASRIFYRIKQ